MLDIALDDTHDLKIDGIEMALVSDAEQVRQQLLIKLKLWVGEWFLDTDFGTPYLQSILGKQLTLSGAVAALRKSILEVEGVRRLVEFEYSFSNQTRKFTVTSFVVETPFGLAEVTP